MASVVGKIIKRGAQTWKVTNGHWSVMMFGWHPTGTNPRWSWEPIEANRVPADVKALE